MRRLLLISTILIACQKAAPPPGAAGPAEAVEAFSAALQKQELNTAWSLLSSKTQAEANKLAHNGDGRAMLLTGVVVGAPVHATSWKQSGETADIVTSRGTYRVVRESGQWRVDLPLAR